MKQFVKASSPALHERSTTRQSPPNSDSIQRSRVATRYLVDCTPHTSRTPAFENRSCKRARIHEYLSFRAAVKTNHFGLYPFLYPPYFKIGNNLGSIGSNWR